MSSMGLEQAQTLLSKHLQDPPLTPQEAKVCLNNYEQGLLQLSEKIMAQVYFALQVLSCANMGESHSNDIKRQQRSKGRKLRKSRTGSRR